MEIWKWATNHIGIVDAAPRVSWKTIILPSYYHSHHQISQPNLIPSAPSSSQQPPSHKYLNCPPFVSTAIIHSLHTSHFTGIHFIYMYFSLRHAFLKIHFLPKLSCLFCGTCHLRMYQSWLHFFPISTFDKWNFFVWILNLLKFANGLAMV